MNFRLLPVVALALLSIVRPAGAATSYDSCTAFIPSLPATLSSTGRYCLDKDLATASASGNAITVTANNVTLDCNGFKVGNLAAGAGSLANGVFTNKRNTRVTDCYFRGFQAAIDGVDAHGAQLDGNVFEGAWLGGVWLKGTGLVVRDNRFIDIGGSTLRTEALSIVGSGDVRGNVIDGVESSGSQAIAIYGVGEFAIIDNSIRGILAPEPNLEFGIYLDAAPGGSVVASNRLQSDNWYASSIYCLQRAVTRDNSIVGFYTLFNTLCSDDGGNIRIDYSAFPP